MQDNIGREIANTARRAPSCVEKHCKQMRGLLRSWRSHYETLVWNQRTWTAAKFGLWTPHVGRQKISWQCMWWHYWYKI